MVSCITSEALLNDPDGVPRHLKLIALPSDEASQNNMLRRRHLGEKSILTLVDRKNM
jgi:hypothetical protein